MYDLIIIGGGPAGVAAGVYAARKRLKTLLIAEAIGGQSIDSNEVQNWIGTTALSGLELAKAPETHLRAYADDIVEIKLKERVERVERAGPHFKAVTKKGSYEGRAVLVVTGGARKKLEAKGADAFENKGLTYCASCDGPLFSGQYVAVVGGGNAGFETAAQLLAYCKSVTLIHRGPAFGKADAATVEAVLKHPNMTALTDSMPIEVKGDGFVKGLVVKNAKTEEMRELPVTGIFVEIGMMPNTALVEGLLELDHNHRIAIDAKTQRTAVEGVWAAGDCTDELYHQNNIAAGDAVKALENIYYWLKAHNHA